MVRNGILRRFVIMCWFYGLLFSKVGRARWESVMLFLCFVVLSYF